MLSGFGIAPLNIRFGDGRVLKGYELEKFKDAFARYLGPQEAQQRYNQAAARDSEVSSSATGDPSSRHKKSPASPMGCSGVADKKGEQVDTVSAGPSDASGEVLWM